MTSHKSCVWGEKDGPNLKDIDEKQRAKLRAESRTGGKGSDQTSHEKHHKSIQQFTATALYKADVSRLSAPILHRVTNYCKSTLCIRPCSSDVQIDSPEFPARKETVCRRSSWKRSIAKSNQSTLGDETRKATISCHVVSKHRHVL